MNRDNLPWSQAPAPALSWDKKGAPHSDQFGDVYYSTDDGLAESRHVFLAGNQLPERWQTGTAHAFCIFESGFGTGLNFLATWQAWLASPTPKAPLHYIAVEKYPLARDDLQRAIANWPELAPLGEALLAQYPIAAPGQHRLVLQDGRILLDLWWLDIDETLGDLAGLRTPLIDAWYLDGFAPARNDSMWSNKVLQRVAQLSRPQATFGTFTAVGQVRRELTNAGFDVSKRSGFGRKRECLHGQLRKEKDHNQEQHDRTPWDLGQHTLERPQHAIVIGAGLAGSFTAAALARRGITVTVVEANEVGSAASGNPQGVLYTRLSRKHSTLTDFAIGSFAYAARRYRQMFCSGQLQSGTDGALCGAFAQSTDEAGMAYLAKALADIPELAQVLDAATASARLGISQPCGGYWLTDSGWLSPAAVCRALLQNSAITVREQCGAVGLARQGQAWQVHNAQGALAEATHVVLATGTATNTFAQCQWLPLRPIRGQTTQLPASEQSNKLLAALCHTGYIAPAAAGAHCIGASFDTDDPDSTLRESDNRFNLQQLGEAVPDWAEQLATLDAATLAGRVGWRCASPDYLPMVGPAPDLEAFKALYAPLRRNARQRVYSPGAYLDGLYLNTAHGSRGLSSTPLAGELIASQICSEAPPLERSLARAVAPARFIIRDLTRNRI